MNHQFIIAATILVSIVSAASAFNFNVDWAQNPKENLNAWSSRMRFQINDNLLFNYNDQAADSVFVVNKQDFDSCDSSNPIQKLQTGSSKYQLTRSGPFYFISSDAKKCQNGEKMMLVVMSSRTKKQPVAATPMISPAPALTSPSLSPSSSVAPSSLTSPSIAPSMAPSSLTSPSMAPSLSSPSMAPTPSSMAPVPFGGEIMPGPTAGGGVPALAPKPMSAASALNAASATVMMAVVVAANVFLV